MAMCIIQHVEDLNQVSKARCKIPNSHEFPEFKIEHFKV